uniref:voltage-dependent calcium channel subunit alpha-2/delta-2 isoform X2 n=1 Tax=Myxine glutinosa TaxID=7769 RepID=UPI00358E1932
MAHAGMIRAKVQRALLISWFLFVVLLLPVRSQQHSLQHSFPDESSVQFWAKQIGNELDKMMRKDIGLDTLKQLYKERKYRFTLEENNAKMLVDKSAHAIEDMLRKKEAALERLTLAAEELQEQHKWKDNIKETDVYYFNAKQNYKNLGDDEEDSDDGGESSNTEEKQMNPTFEVDDDFKQPINKNFTAVHIPTDIYNGSTIILNELNWTANLDKVFKMNRMNDTSLLWQVFGSATGLARYYPAAEWQNKQNKVDLYDVRRRPWYVQGAASPKDMLILMDVSGSMSGMPLNLMKTSVENMLDTLADDDFVNIVFFNDTAATVGCFNNLVQANVRNKRELKKSVQMMTAKGVTNYTAGLQYAFNQLLDTKDISRANCNKMIMLFTDGGEDRARQVFKNNNTTVRVFTFSVGQHNYDISPIQWMACNNKGYFFEIPSIGAIRLNTQEYLDVLGRPMVLAGSGYKQVQWTNVYKDALGLGLVITGTLPVFNLSKEGGKQNQLILGVMGVDVSLDEVKRLTPQFRMGANGYFFAMDPNGYVLLHPNLLPKVPNFQEPVTLDFLDAELHHDKKVMIRKNMISGESGSETFETIIKSVDERYVDKAVRTYTWTTVNSTDYSLALVMPSYSTYHIKAKKEDERSTAEDAESLLRSFSEPIGHVFIAPREFCKTVQKSDNNTEFLLNFLAELQKNKPDSENCDSDLVYNLLLDSSITTKLVETTWVNVDRQGIGIKALFVTTDSGITKVYPNSAAVEWDEALEPYNASSYKRSLNNNGSIYKPPYTPENSHDNFTGSVLASLAVEVTIDGKTLKPAVIGVQLDQEAWTTKFKFLATNQTGEAPTRRTCGGLGSCEMDCEASVNELECVLLDDGGFLVLSNQDDHQDKIGKFFGVVNPSLMRALFNFSIYDEVTSYDFQSVCDPDTEPRTDAAPRGVHIPSIADLLNLAWWTSAAAWSILQQFLYSLTFQAWHDPVPVMAASESSKEKMLCITLQTQYFLNQNVTSFRTLQDCKNCSRFMHVEKIAHSNLLLLITEKITCSGCDNRPLSQEETLCILYSCDMLCTNSVYSGPRPILRRTRSVFHASCPSLTPTAEGPNQCLLATEPRFRKGPEVCLDADNYQEDASDCGKGSMLQPSMLALFILPLFTLCLLGPAAPYIS